MKKNTKQEKIQQNLTILWIILFQQKLFGEIFTRLHFMAAIIKPRLFNTNIENRLEWYRRVKNWSWSKKLFPYRNAIFQDKDAFILTAEIVSKWHKEHSGTVEHLICLSPSPELNIIEQLW